MEQNLKVLAVVQSDVIPRNLMEVFSRESILFHHARSGAAALILTGNSLYDLLVVQAPLADLPVENVLSTLQSFEWASAGTPALVVVDDSSLDKVSRLLQDHPVRVLPLSAGKREIQEAVSELLGVPVRSSSRMIVNVEVRTGSNSSLRCFQSENISEAGLLLRGAQAIPIGTAVNLEFSLPDEPTPVRSTALVVRHTGGDEAPGVGLRFVELDRSELLRLRRFVDRTLAETPPIAASKQSRTSSQTVGA